MRAELLQEPDPSGAVAERDQRLAEQPDADRRAVRLGDLARQQRGQPVAPHQPAERRPLPHPGDELVVFPGQHPSSPAKPGAAIRDGARRDRSTISTGDPADTRGGPGARRVGDPARLRRPGIRRSAAVAAPAP